MNYSEARLLVQDINIENSTSYTAPKNVSKYKSDVRQKRKKTKITNRRKWTVFASLNVFLTVQFFYNKQLQ